MNTIPPDSKVRPFRPYWGMRLIWPPRRRFLLLRYGEDRSFRVSFRQYSIKGANPNLSHA